MNPIIAQKALRGETLSKTRLLEIVREAGFLPDGTASAAINKEKTEEIYELAHRITRTFMGNRFDSCSIINAKSGNCPEDCKWCAQSIHNNTVIEAYPLIPASVAVENARKNCAFGIRRFSLVTSGKKVSKKEIDQICDMVRAIKKQSEAIPCVSLGLADEEDMQKLARAGVTRYHCNIESSPGYFRKLCTSHTTGDKLKTLLAARKAGMSLCSGGIIGMGETLEDRIDMALFLRKHHIFSIPINVLHPIKGTPLEHIEPLGEEEYLLTVALFRIINPHAFLRFSGGRALLSKKIQEKALYIGINAAIMGDMLTTVGTGVREDIKMFTGAGYDFNASVFCSPFTAASFEQTRQTKPAACSGDTDETENSEHNEHTTKYKQYTEKTGAATLTEPEETAEAPEIKDPGIKEENIEEQSIKKKSTEEQSIKKKSIKEQNTEKMSTEERNVKKKSIEEQSAEKQNVKEQNTEELSVKKKSNNKGTAIAKKQEIFLSTPANAERINVNLFSLNESEGHIIPRTESLPDELETHIWHPYSSTTSPSPTYFAEGARGVRIKIKNPGINGHGHPAECSVQALHAKQTANTGQYEQCGQNEQSEQNKQCEQNDRNEQCEQCEQCKQNDRSDLNKQCEQNDRSDLNKQCEQNDRSQRPDPGDYTHPAGHREYAGQTGLFESAGSTVQTGEAVHTEHIEYTGQIAQIQHTEKNEHIRYNIRYIKYTGKLETHRHAPLCFSSASSRLLTGNCRICEETVSDESIELIDGMSSWWAAIHGYNHPVLNRAVRDQLDRMSHIMFGGFTHGPARELTRLLLNILPRPLTKIFYSDSGSVSVEVAMKMAVQYWAGKGCLEKYAKKTKFATIRSGYHGDTWHAMSVCDPVTGMHGLFGSSLPVQFFAPAPRTVWGWRLSGKFAEPRLNEASHLPTAGGINNLEIFQQNAQSEKIFDKNKQFQNASSGTLHPGGESVQEELLEKDLRALEEIFREHADEIAAFILEPVVQGAGGMRFYAPQYLVKARELCDRYGILLIFDEIATGFGRTGKMFAWEHAGAVPDIMTIGKGLTGGYMTLAATLCTGEVAEAVCRAEPGVFMHGPTFMGNPLACAVACASVKLLSGSEWKKNIKRIEALLIEGLAPAAELSSVQEVRVLGAIGVIELKEPVSLEIIQPKLVEHGIWLRPFGKLVYTMPPYIIENSDLHTLCRETIAVLREIEQGKSKS